MSDEHEGQDESWIGKFRLHVYDGKHARGEPNREFSGQGTDWRNYQTVRVEGFDGSATVQLHEIWKELLEGRQSRLVAPAIGLETIVKFGGTKQLRHDLTVVIEVEPADATPAG